jgi:hypothetical protein
MTVATQEVDLVQYQKLRKAGIEDMVQERQELHGKVKEYQGRIQQISAKIMGVMLKLDITKAQVGSYPVAVVTDSTYSKFDREGFMNFLVEKGVDPKLLQRAKDRFTVVETKRPYLRVGGGHDE